jgi:hypothetical protein
MSVLGPRQLNRLIRDLELTAPVAIRRALPQAEQYLWLLMRLRVVDVRTDAEYQQRLSRLIGLRGKLRMHRAELFLVLHDLLALESPNFGEVLRRVSALSGQVEKLVASMFLALLQPEQPWIDRDIRELLPRYGFVALAEAPRFEECVGWYVQLSALFEEVLAAPRWAAVGGLLDRGLTRAEGAVLTEARKLNLHLSHSRRAVALMPTLDLVPAQPIEHAVELAPLSVRGERLKTPGAVRLHLCR